MTFLQDLNRALIFLIQHGETIFGSCVALNKIYNSVCDLGGWEVPFRRGPLFLFLVNCIKKRNFFLIDSIKTILGKYSAKKSGRNS